jgi:hypothetical protein
MTTFLHPVPKLRMTGAMPPLPYRSLWPTQGLYETLVQTALENCYAMRAMRIYL